MQSIQLRNDTLVDIATFLVRRWSGTEKVTVEFSKIKHSETRLKEKRVLLMPNDQYHGNDFNTEILVASIRHPQHVVDAAKIGADIVTVPGAVLGKMLTHTLTDKGLKAFLADWEKLKSENPNVEI